MGLGGRWHDEVESGGHAVDLTGCIVRHIEYIVLCINPSLLLDIYHSLKDHVFIAYLTLLVFAILIEFDLLFQLPAQLRRSNFIPNFFHSFHSA